MSAMAVSVKTKAVRNIGTEVRKITEKSTDSAPWYVTNQVLHKDLKVITGKSEIF